jgi:hypothetical protein
MYSNCARVIPCFLDECREFPARQIVFGKREAGDRDIVHWAFVIISALSVMGEPIRKCPAGMLTKLSGGAAGGGAGA